MVLALHGGKNGFYRFPMVTQALIIGACTSNVLTKLGWGVWLKHENGEVIARIW